MVSVLDDKVYEFLKFDDAVGVASHVSLDEQGLHKLVRGSQVHFLQHSFEYFAGDNPIVVPLETPEQFPEHEFLGVLLLAQLEEALPE